MRMRGLGLQGDAQDPAAPQNITAIAGNIKALPPLAGAVRNTVKGCKRRSKIDYLSGLTLCYPGNNTFVLTATTAFWDRAWTGEQEESECCAPRPQLSPRHTPSLPSRAPVVPAGLPPHRPGRSRRPVDHHRPPPPADASTISDVVTDLVQEPGQSEYHPPRNTHSPRGRHAPLFHPLVPLLAPPRRRYFAIVLQTRGLHPTDSRCRQP